MPAAVATRKQINGALGGKRGWAHWSTSDGAMGRRSTVITCSYQGCVGIAASGAVVGCARLTVKATWPPSGLQLG